MIEALFLAYIHGELRLSDSQSDLENVATSLQLLSGKSIEGNTPQLIVGFSSVLEERIIPVLDKLPAQFFVSSEEKKKQILDVLVKDDDLLAQAFVQKLLFLSYQDIQKEITNYFKNVDSSKEMVLVQSATECEPQLKAEIRAAMGSNSFTSFATDAALLGGIRVLRNQKVADSSWRAKLIALKKLATNL